MLDLVEEQASYVETYPVEGGTLNWYPELGIGYLKTPALVPYDKEYWEKYWSYRGNEIGEKLTAGREALVKQYTPEAIIDVGIGSGEFVEKLNCWGHDINTFAIEWLKANGKYRDPLVLPCSILTMWDVLEHIPNPGLLLASAFTVYTSLPIYETVDKCLASKHLRPGEHVWHFTDKGIKTFMKIAGFSHYGTSSFETDLGREEIMSYVFSKVNINLENINRLS
jgi:hypothetical protein